MRDRKLNRLPGYDYSQGGFYFITICVKDREECMGKIREEKIIYSPYGAIALKYWQAIPSHYKNVFLDEWVIMPDHIHGIIIIKNERTERTEGTEQCSVRTDMDSMDIDSMDMEATDMDADAQKNKNYGLLSRIVKSFKEISLKSIRKQFDDYNFAWQRSFYDNIIRNEKALINIRAYIRNNPVKWERDKNNL